MDSKENCSRTAVSFLHQQVAALKTHHGQECDAKTVLQLLQMCPALQSSVKLLLQALSPPPLLAAKAYSLLEQLTNCTRDLHRDGGIEVRDNSEVWQDLVSAVEGVVSTVLQCVDVWLQKRQSELHNCLFSVKWFLQKNKKDIQAKAGYKNEVYNFVLEVVEKISAALKGMRHWESFIPDERKKVLNVWLQQLYTVTQLLPRVAVLMISLNQKCTGKDKPSSPSFISLSVVTSRLEEIINEIVNATSLKFDDVFSENSASVRSNDKPGAFLTAVDKVLDLLTSAVRELELQEHSTRSISGEPRTHTTVAKSSSNPTKSFTIRPESLTTSPVQKKIFLKPESNQSGSEFESSEKLRNCYDASYECVTITKTDQGSTVLPYDEVQVASSLGQLVKVPLEEILRHVISIAYCSSPSDNKAIMSLCEEVLAHLKELVNIKPSEPGSSGQVVDHAIACERLAESVERLEQCANTALIRCYVRTFADVTLPLDTLLRAVQSAVTSSSGPQQNPSATLPVVQERVADLDEHVDAIFQLAALAAASSTDQSRCSSVRSCLLTLEWLESVLVPVLLQPCPHSPSAVATPWMEKQAQLFAEHWKDAAVALRQCLDASLDPAAFVMVTQNEVHAAWWLLKQKLYCRDVGEVQEPVQRVLSMTERLTHLHESEAFMSDEQTEQLARGTDELRRSVEAVSAAPENLRMRRSLLKRVQLVLTVVTRLSSSLHSTTLRDNTALRYSMRPNLLGRPMLPSTSGEQAVAQDNRNWVATSDIRDVPLDVATPFRNLPRSSLRSKNPHFIDASSAQEDATAASYGGSASDALLERTSHESSYEKQCFDMQETSDCGSTASRISQKNQVARTLRESNSTERSKFEVDAIDPTKTVRASSSVLSNHSVTEHTDGQIQNLSAILVKNRVSSDMNVTSSARRPNCDDSNVMPFSAVETNFDHLKSINCTFGIVCDDTTLDITRLLASNTIDPAIRSSIRASVRSRLLKSLRGKHQSPVVKELSVDLSNIISPADTKVSSKAGASKLPPRSSRTVLRGDEAAQRLANAASLSCANDAVHSKNDAVTCVSGNAVDPDVQRSQSDNLLPESKSLVQEITGLMENFSTFACNFSSSCTTVRPLQSSDLSAKENSVTNSEENSGNCVGKSAKPSDLDGPRINDLCTSDKLRACRGRKADSHCDDAEVLRGIKLHGASFSPQFPCIESTNKIGVSSTISGDESGNKENIDFDAVSSSCDSIAVGNTKAPCRSKLLNFNNSSLSPTHIMTSIIHEAEQIFSDQNARPELFESALGSEKIPALSDDETAVDAVTTQRSPLRDLNSSSPDNTSIKKQVKFPFKAGLVNPSDVTSAEKDLEASSNYKTISFKSSVASISTPDSVDVDTPQRLLDIQTLRTKLGKLKSIFRL